MKVVSKLLNEKKFWVKPFCFTGHEVCSLGCSSLSGLVVIVLVRKMVVLARRCKALFFLSLCWRFCLFFNPAGKGQRIKEYMSRWGMCLFELPRLDFKSAGSCITR